MKTITTIALMLALAFNAVPQACTTHTISISVTIPYQPAETGVNSRTLCETTHALLVGTGANTYTWSNGQIRQSIYHDVDPVLPNTMTLSVGNNSFAVIGEAIENNQACFGSATINIYLCVTALTGIEQYGMDGKEVVPVYYDLQGTRIDRRSNELIIEQRGNVRRKVFIQN